MRRSRVAVSRALAGLIISTAACAGCSEDGSVPRDAPDAGTSTPANPDIATLSCNTPQCCMQTKVSVWLVRLFGSLQLSVLAERGDTSGASWNVSIDGSSPWGSVDCTMSVLSTKGKAFAFICPLSSSTSVECGDKAQLTLRLNGFAYSDSGGTAALCSTSNSKDVAVALPVQCPSCPAPELVGNASPCETPVQQCNYRTSIAPSGEVGLLPCTCSAFEEAELRWYCAIN
jgi:hypothetical protein